MDTFSETPPVASHDERTSPPWERLPTESTQAWTAFQRYRDLGLRRSLDAVDRELYPASSSEQRPPSAGHRRRGCVSGWSRQHQWVSRAAAWDAELDRQARITQVETVRAMNERHATAARALQSRAIEALQTLAAKDFGASDVLRFLVEACKLERLAVGEVTERSAQEVSGATPVTLRLVERIVAVRGSDRPTTGNVVTAPVESIAATQTPGGTACGDDNEADDFEFPDEPPEFLGYSQTCRPADCVGQRT